MNRIAVTVLAALTLMLTGCVTPINWNARIGIYTYDQAVMDYGPPVSLTSLSDGSTVAEWMTERGTVLVTPGPYVYGPGFYSPRGFYYGYYGPGGMGYSTTYFPAHFIRLEFGADHRLKAWKEFSK